VTDNTWGETTLTWDNRPQSGGALTNWAAAQNVPIELSVVDAVQSALTNGGRVSFHVLAPDSAALVSYASREDHALYAPRLIVITSNTPPSIATISNQSVLRNGFITVPFTIGDAETPADLLELSASSSNTNLIPRANIMLSGVSGDRSISLLAASNQLGTATILVSVDDGVLSTTMSFVLNVVGTNNRPTSVQITSPANNAVFSAPANIPLAASAIDPDGNVMRVDYVLANGIIGSATSSPYSFIWNDVPFGTYALRAIATDEGGLSVTSALRQIFVSNAPVTLLAAGAVWKFYDVSGVDLGTAWRETNYNDSAWASGAARLGFGDPATTSVNSDPTRVTTYFRSRFIATNTSLITGLTIGLIRDDGAVVYLNGTEVFRSNMPLARKKPRGSPTRPPACHSSGPVRTWWLWKCIREASAVPTSASTSCSSAMLGQLPCRQSSWMRNETPTISCFHGRRTAAGIFIRHPHSIRERFGPA
jgi:hypothetical protein